MGRLTASQQASVAHTPSCVRVANGLRLARSGISKSRELILVRGGVSFKEASAAVGHHMILVSGGAVFPFPGLRRHGRTASTSPRAFFGFVTDHLRRIEDRWCREPCIWSRVLISP